MSAPDLFHANLIAREMVLALGMGRRMGPLDLMHVVPANQNTGMLLRSPEVCEEGGGMHETPFVWGGGASMYGSWHACVWW